MYKRRARDPTVARLGHVAEIIRLQDYARDLVPWVILLSASTSICMAFKALHTTEMTETNRAELGTTEDGVCHHTASLPDAHDEDAASIEY